MNVAFTIVPALATDLPAVVDLCMLVEAQHEAYNALRWKTRPNIRQGYLRWLSGHLDDPQMLILAAKAAESGTPVIGALLADIEEEIPIYAYSHYAFIHDLAVAEGYRRQGIATAMLAQARQWAGQHGVNQLRLMAAVQNPAAHMLFRTMVFQDTYHEMILAV